MDRSFESTMNRDPTQWSSKDWFTYLRSTIQKSFTYIEKAGEGNMNLTLRVQNSTESIIIKHSPPYCAKFPHIPAPVERLRTEFLFYKTIESQNEIQKMIPQIIHFDVENNILLMQDLGKCQDYSYLYERYSQLQENIIDKLCYFINELHSIKTLEYGETLKNPLMKALNHQYIFDLPYNDHSFDVENLFPTQSEFVKKIKTDQSIVKKAYLFGEIYKNEGQHLLHGDYYPASWLKNHDKIFIIDPEFCFTGKIEFELSVVIAHMLLAKQSSGKIQYFLKNYKHHYNKEDVEIFASIEIIRRLIYVSQLPLKANENERVELLEMAVEVIKGNASWI